ncbi:MAG: hypothetical protein ACRC46_11600 [Thermoguttaceae bacterium]
MSHLWPGYRGLTHRGGWAFLGIALLFAIILNGAIVVLGFWSAFGTPLLRWGVVVAVPVLWASLSFLATVLERRAVPAVSATIDEKFRDVMVQYLCGSWYEAEIGLQQILKQNSRDVEASLFYATLLRRTGRPAEAAARLKTLRTLDNAAAWSTEIDNEERLATLSD